MHFYSPEYCPKADPEENLRWRLRWREKARFDKGLQDDFRQAAFEDVLFWFNALCWCFEPRSLIKIRPFCTWPHQDPAILAMDGAITDSESSEEPIDLVVNKSRGQGATWMYLMIFLRRWLRDDLFSAGLVSKNEEMVDSARDPDTLMWKIVWMLDRLPFWMIPEGFDLRLHRSLTEHSLVNPQNNASIVGYSATSDVGSGGRKTVFAMDEYAKFGKGKDYAAGDSTQHVTNCRFLVSTFLGDSGAFYDAATEDTNAVQVILDWKDNPTQNAKLYRVEKGRIIEEDPRDGNRLETADYERIADQHTRLKRKGYKIEGRVRNVWYNAQCLRPVATPRGIAQELDRDPHGSVAKVFDAVTLQEVRARCVLPPILEGRLVYDSETAEVRNPFVVEAREGELKLWVRPGLDGQMARGSYVLGADIAAGTGGAYSSNSVACIINRMTGEQVCEWASNTTRPSKFAYVCVALGHWFHDALLIPEANFSSNFINILVETLVYPNLYYRETKVVGLHKKTRNPGFWMDGDNKRLGVFESMQAAMATEAFTPRSAALLDECPQYEWKNGKIIHVASTTSQDEGAKGKAHGDRVIAAALAWLGCEEEPILGDSVEQEAGLTGMAARLREHDDRNRREDSWGDDLDIEPGISSTYLDGVLL